MWLGHVADITKALFIFSAIGSVDHCLLVGIMTLKHLMVRRDSARWRSNLLILQTEFPRIFCYY